MLVYRCAFWSLITGAVRLKTLPPRSSTKWLCVALKANAIDNGTRSRSERDLMPFPPGSPFLKVRELRERSPGFPWSSGRPDPAVKTRDLVEIEQRLPSRETAPRAIPRDLQSRIRSPIDNGRCGRFNARSDECPVALDKKDVVGIRLTGVSASVQPRIWMVACVSLSRRSLRTWRRRRRRCSRDAAANRSTGRSATLTQSLSLPGSSIWSTMAAKTRPWPDRPGWRVRRRMPRAVRTVVGNGISVAARRMTVGVPWPGM